MARVIIDKTVTILAALAAALIIIDTLAVFVDVLARSLWGLTFPILFEFTEYSLIWMTFLSTAWLMKLDGHIRLEIIVSRMVPKSRAFTNFFVSIICGTLLGVLIWYSTILTLHDYQNNVLFASVVRPPKWPVEIIIPIGYFLLLIQLIMKTHGYLMSWKAAYREKETAPDSVDRGEQ